MHVTAEGELRAALEGLGLHPPRPTVVVVGGAAGLEEARMNGLRPLFADVIAPAMHRYGAVGVDGGTGFGVMRLFGEARGAGDATFPLLGVVAAGPVQLLRRDGPSSHVPATLEPNHTHFVVVPGQEWGAEAPWIARTATVLSGGAPSVTVLVNGGEIAYSDVRHSLEAGRPIVVVSGSGGTADVFADALAGGPGAGRVAALVGSGLIHAVRIDEPATLAEALTGVLGAAAEQ
jgi:TRPM family ion channel